MNPKADHPEDDKHALRRVVRERLAELSEPERAAASAAVCRTLLGLPQLRAARTLLVYLPLAPEVDIAPACAALAERGVALAAPRLDWDARAMHAIPLDAWPPRVERRRFNLPEPLDAPPLPTARLDAVIVPGLAFDTLGGRLGRGAGFYDRYLAQLNTSTTRIAVCFAAQVVPRVPVDTHDVRMHEVVCETGPIMHRQSA